MCGSALYGFMGSGGVQRAEELIFKMDKCDIFVLKKFYVIELK